MERQRVAAPTARFAQPTDAPAVTAFRCGHTPWYVEEAAKVIRKSASLLDASPPGLRVVLFEHAHELAGISVVQQGPTHGTADLAVLAIRTHLQGAWIEETPERPLCVAVLEETIDLAAREGYERIVAMAAEQNTKSVRLITRAGFSRVAPLDGDYVLYQAVLPVVEAPELT